MTAPSSGSYPIPQALTVAEVAEQLSSQVTHRCDEMPPLELIDGVWSRAIPCGDCGGTGTRHEPWFLDSPEVRERLEGSS